MSEPTLNEMLIEEVKKYQFLYNKRERDYKNTVKKTRTWEEIAVKLHLAGGDEVCKRWKSLRDRFTRELKKQSDLNNTGSESQQFDIQIWDLFESLSFLKDHCEPNKKTMTNYKCIDTTSVNMQAYNKPSCSAVEASTSSDDVTYVQESEPASNENVPLTRRPQKRKYTIQDVNEHFMEAAKSFKDMCFNTASKKEEITDDELFGQRVVSFIGAIVNDENKENAKASVLRHLANCVANQYD
ncbi:hypothetical protein FQR65_LT19281 [Abscondita terminalis]|nr:hypothetical protein FQR65_LT19281 [Abscondita terminalis]